MQQDKPAASLPEGRAVKVMLKKRATNPWYRENCRRLDVARSAGSEVRGFAVH